MGEDLLREGGEMHVHIDSQETVRKLRIFMPTRKGVN